jgi:hypothetical protein
VIRSPGLANETLRVGAVAFQQQRASQRKLALGGERLVLVKIRAHGLGIEAFLPERRLRASAQQTDIRPARILGDKGNIALEVDLLAAQNCPLDHVAGDGIAHAFFYVACLRQLALARQRDCCLDRGESSGITGQRIRFLIGTTTGSADLQDGAQDARDRERHQRSAEARNVQAVILRCLRNCLQLKDPTAWRRKAARESCRCSCLGVDRDDPHPIVRREDG